MGTKDCQNGFFFAVYVFFVAKNLFGEGVYRSVTLGNGSVLAEDRLFPPFAALSNKDVPGGTPALLNQCNSNRLKAFQTDSNQKKENLTLK